MSFPWVKFGKMIFLIVVGAGLSAVRFHVAATLGGVWSKVTAGCRGVTVKCPHFSRKVAVKWRKDPRNFRKVSVKFP